MRRTALQPMDPNAVERRIPYQHRYSTLYPPPSTTLSTVAQPSRSPTWTPTLSNDALQQLPLATTRRLTSLSHPVNTDSRMPTLTPTAVCLQQRPSSLNDLLPHRGNTSASSRQHPHRRASHQICVTACHCFARIPSDLRYNREVLAPL